MLSTRMHELARKLTNPTYLSACFHWGGRLLTGVQVHDVYSADLQSARRTLPDSGLCFRVLETTNDLHTLPAGMEEQVDAQSGLSCRHLVENDARIYLLTHGEQLACQLNIRCGEVTIDSPTDLRLRFDADTAFLNYLYTREPYRGRSLAGELISRACDDLAQKGVRRCLAHIRATNHASLASFKKAGWMHCGRIISTTSGRFIAAPGCEKSGMLVQPLNRA